jgi:hypothetical protein
MTFKIRVTASVPALVSAGLILGFVIGVLAYRTAQDMTQLSDLKAASAAPPALEKATATDAGYPTDLVRVPQADELAAALGKLGFDVHLMADEDIEKGSVTKETYSVMVIGREVPPRLAAPAIRLTHQYLPWVKYVYVQFQYSVMDRHLVLNAQNGWVESLGLKPLSDADFARLSDARLSLEEFHAILQEFRSK